MSHLAAVPDRPARVVLYVRVSALMGRRGAEFHSPDVQLAAMRRATVGMREVAVVTDLDRTGRNFTREGIDRIRDMAEAKQIDAIAIYNISRFGRNVLESLKFLNWLADRGVTILSASESIDTSTPSGRWMLTTMLGLAEMRSDEIGIEWSNTIRNRAKAGLHHGRPPTGYLREGGKLVEDPAVGPVVRATFAEYAAGGSVRKLRYRLQVATNSNMAAHTMKRLLANRAYLGLVLVRGGPEVPGHVPLVDQETFDRVQERIAADRRTHPKIVGARYSLSGLGRCSVCKGVTNIRPHSRGHRIYCRGQFERVRTCPGCGSLRLVDVEAALLKRIVKRIALLRGDVATRAAQLAQRTRAGVDAGALKRELDATRRAMAKATERWARGGLDDQVYDDTMASFRQSEERLSVALAGVRRTADMPEPGELVSLAEKLVELWPRMDGNQRNRALRDLIDYVEIWPAAFYRQPADQRVEPKWRGDG